MIWNVQAIEELSYWIGFNPRRTVVRAGRIDDDGRLFFATRLSSTHSRQSCGVCMRVR